MSAQECLVFDLGSVGYPQAWELQKALAVRRAEGAVPNVLLLLEHPHVFTLGRRGRESDVLLTPEERARLGVALHHTDRGGLVTYHGPGQLVGYPIIDLRTWGGGPVRYVRTLEEALMRATQHFRVASECREGLPGVWVDERKLAAIGVRVSRGVTTHGFALNVSTDLSYFRHIVPCGLPGLEVTSLERELGVTVDLARVRQEAVRAFGERFGFTMRWATPADTARVLGDTPTATPAR
ncbi:MAG: lipoyl(octanoyl) transferase LipB [Dehalococcoidia bacterium]|nr:lipoyl(octanoyl) transferase LipB [Dehalococcoidia bacterium]